MRRQCKTPQLDRQSGFTIVELMIATLVFAIILLVITAGVLSFTHSYYKGVNSSNVQDRARTVVDTVAQAIQFSGSAVVANSATTNYFCAGGKVFWFTPGVLFPGGTPTTSNLGLYEQDDTSASCSPPTTISSSGTELLGPRMRIANLVVAPPTATPPVVVPSDVYSIKLRVVYGDDDLVCAPSVPNSCTSSTQLTAAQLVAATDLQCRPQEGGQFCAVSELSTTVEKRLQ